MSNDRPYNGETIEYLKSKGYKQTSRKFGMVSRVDMSDEALKRFFIKDNFGDTKSGIPSCTLEQQKDQYRRVYSKDSIAGVPEKILKYLR